MTAPSDPVDLAEVRALLGNRMLKWEGGVWNPGMTAELAAAAPTLLAALADEVERLRGDVARVRGLHTVERLRYAIDGHVTETCEMCCEPWPCPTVAALDPPAQADTEEGGGVSFDMARDTEHSGDCGGTFCPHCGHCAHSDPMVSCRCNKGGCGCDDYSPRDGLGADPNDPPVADEVAVLRRSRIAVFDVLDELDNGDHASAGRDYGRGIAYATRLIRAALDTQATP